MEKPFSPLSAFVSRLFSLSVLFALLSAFSASAAQVSLVSAGSVWKYRYSTNAPPDGWRAVTFGAIEWKSGPAPLGYGDPWIVTTLDGATMEPPRPITAYFRNVFMVDDASVFNGLVLRLMRDDGAVVYLNGTEVLRSNMPDGIITPTTLAPVVVGTDVESQYAEFALPAAQLRSGTNVVAVEVHQANALSSDMGFDLELQGTTGPLVSIVASTAETSEPLPNATVAPGVFTLRRSGPTDQGLLVWVGYGGTATWGTDYTSLSNVVEFPAGKSEVTLPVLAHSDDLVEGNETVVAELQLPPTANPLPDPYAIDSAKRRAVVTIRDEDTNRVSVRFTRPADWDSFGFGTTIGLRVVAVDPNGYVPKVEFYDGDNLIGTSQIDFIAAPTNGTPIAHEFNWAGATVGTHSLTARGYSSTGAIGTSAVVHINVAVVDPPPLPVVSIFATRPETSEPTSVLHEPGEFTIYRNGPTNSSLSVWVNYGGTATKGSDYQAPTNLVTIQAGRFDAKLYVAALGDDLIEGDETVVAELGAPPTAGFPTYTINPEHRVATVVIHDEDTNRVGVQFTRPIEGQAFYFGTAIGLRAVASDPNGYVPKVEFYDGDILIGTSQIEFFTAPTNGTPIAHEITWMGAALGTHSLRAKGYSSTGATGISPVVHISVVEMPPPLPIVSIVASRAETSEPGPTLKVAPGEFTLKRTGSNDVALSVWVYFGGTATKGSDYVALSNIVTFPVGASETTVQVVANQDEVLEGDETVVAELAPPPPTAAGAWQGYGIDPEHRRAVVTIHDSTPQNGQVVLAVETPDANASEASSLTVIDPAVFLIKRIAGPTNIPVVVYYEMSGTASNGVDYAKLEGHALMGSNQMRLEIVVKPIYDSILEGEESVVLTLVPPACIAVVPPPPDCYLVGPTNTGRAVIRDFSGENHAPVAHFVKPVNGAVFTVGQTIEIVAEASDPDGTVAKLVILDNGVEIGASVSNRIALSLTGATVGQHVLSARATDNQGKAGDAATITILVREQNASAFVFRHLPDAYTPGTGLTVELRAEPPDGTRAYGVEDHPPLGWVVSEISHEGVFDPATGKVKFGPFIDALARTLTYKVTPPATASGPKEFFGIGSVDGASYAIGGDRVIVQGSTKHPADTDGNWSIILNELTGYAAAWKGGASWNAGPVPIPLSFVTRAGMIWRRGEVYQFNSALGAPPLCWVPVNVVASNVVAALSADGAVRVGGDGLAPGISANMQINVAPPSGTSAYAVEEHVPIGWVISNVSHEGKVDAETGTIRWGVFLDGAARGLTYTVTPPADVAEIGHMRGVVSFDGNIREVTGSDRVVSVNGDTLPRLENCEATATGVKLQLGGAAGQVGVLQRSSDLVNWEDVTTLFLPDGTVEFVDETPTAQAQVYYRLQVR